MSKVRKALRAAQNLALDCLAWIASKLVGPDEPIWLFAERGFDARDNGYWLFKYCSENHYDERRNIFVIASDSPDYQKVSSIGETVEYRSFKHRVLMMQAEALISTHDCGYTPDMVIYHHIMKHGLFIGKGKQVFLQHGIDDKIIQWYMRSEFSPDICLAGTVFDRDNMVLNHHQPDYVVKMTGLPRYDGLSNTQTRNIILVMPTWRKLLVSKTPNGFERTLYHREYMSLLEDDALNNLLQKSGYELVFYPHIEMQRFFPPRRLSDTARIASMETDDVQMLLRECEVLVTDYSSVFFDAAYMGKKIVFLQFDREEYEGGHYEQVLTDYSLFGYVTGNSAETSRRIGECISEPTDRYAEHNHDFFVYHDTEHCQRAYKAIAESVTEGEHR